MRKQDDTIYHLIRGSSGGNTGSVDDKQRGVGCSEYSLQCGVMNPDSFLEAIEEEKCRHTRITFWNAWSTGINVSGVIAGHIPFKMRSDGAFDLYDWRDDYFARLETLLSNANRRGIFPVISLLELYTWSERKQGTPPKELQPFQNNINGLFWSDKHSDAVWGEIATPGDWVWAFAAKVSPLLNKYKCGIETGNELPEKALHARIYDAFRAAGFKGPIQTNRQEDKPSMLPNMISGIEPGGSDKRDYATLSWHGRASMAYLDEVFDGEPSSRPSTFRSMWDHTYDGPEYPRDRMVFSSDGCRSYNQIDTYNWDELVPVAVDAINRGIAAYEHQSVTKMRLGLEGKFRPEDVHDYDSKLLRPAVAAWEALNL